MHPNDEKRENDRCTKYTTVEALRLVEAAVRAVDGNRSVELEQVEDNYRIEIKVRAW